MNFEQYQRLKKVDFWINLTVLVLTPISIIAVDWVILVWMLPLVVGSWQFLSFTLWHICTPSSYYLQDRKQYGIFSIITVAVSFIWFLTIESRFDATIILGIVLLLISSYMATWYIRLTYHEAFEQIPEQ